MTRQFGEGGDVAAGLLGEVVGVEDLGDVAVEVTDRRVELRQGDAQHGHPIDASTLTSRASGTDSLMPLAAGNTPTDPRQIRQPVYTAFTVGQRIGNACRPG